MTRTDREIQPTPRGPLASVVPVALLLGAIGFAVVLVMGTAAAQETTEAPPDEGLMEFATRYGTPNPNPHIALSCTDCHREIPDDTSYLSAISSLKSRPSRLCKSCHPRYANIHPVDRKPTMIPPEVLPLDRNGNITCTTCHRLHDPSSEFKLLRGFLDGEYQHRRDLCFACHGTDLFEKNPHKAEMGDKRCTYCHQRVPDPTETPDTITFRVDVIQMCNFCHDVQRKFHPLNVDPGIRVPENLPRDANGKVTCGTCHNPHGEPDTVHFLRKGYVDSIQSVPGRGHGVNPDCTGCHPGEPKPGEIPGLRYSGNAVVLCKSCHGAGGDVHPVDIEIPRGITKPKDLPLSADGRITCLTCHDIDCAFPPVSDGSGTSSFMGLLTRDRQKLHSLLEDREKITRGTSIITTRFFNPSEGDNSLCFKCHPKRQFEGFSPHMGIDFTKTENFNPKHCRFCHDIDPGRGGSTVESVSFISSPRMICMRCHPERAHPANRDHLIKPKKIRVPRQFPLDMDGKITCSTCHDPHTSKVGIKKSRAADESICIYCHKQK